MRSAHLFWCLTFWLSWDWWFEIAQHIDPPVIVREPNVVQALEALALSILDVFDLVADVVRLHGYREAQVKSFQSHF